MKRYFKKPTRENFRMTYLKRPDSKYHTAPIDERTRDGITFASKGEMYRYLELKLKEKAGEIKDLELQPRYELIPQFTDWKGEKYNSITYVADFRYYEVITKRIVVEDFKGYETDVFKIKEKLLRYKYPDLDFRIII